jgi:DNA-directed RNA polymerase specialized sigma24 family protein
MSTSSGENQKDIELLQHDPQGLLLRYQATLQIIVRLYVRSGMFRARDTDDIIQTLNEQLLLRLPAIRAQYNGSSLLKTYLSAIVRNLCIDLYHEGSRQLEEVPLEEHTGAQNPQVTIRYDIEHTRTVFRAVLKQFDYKLELPRLLFLLKLRYRLPIEKEDLLKCFPNSSETDLNSLLKILGRDFEAMPDKEIFELITPVLNKADGRANTPEAIRKWTKGRVNSIIELLNGSPPTGSFDEETLKILVEDFFSPFLLKNK